jgi:hypothetical protein
VLAVKAGSKTIHDLQQELSTIGLSNVLLSVLEEELAKLGKPKTEDKNSIIKAVKNFFSDKEK